MKTRTATYYGYSSYLEQAYNNTYKKNQQTLSQKVSHHVNDETVLLKTSTEKESGLDIIIVEIQSRSVKFLLHYLPINKNKNLSPVFLFHDESFDKNIYKNILNNLLKEPYCLITSEKSNIDSIKILLKKQQLSCLPSIYFDTTFSVLSVGKGVKDILQTPKITTGFTICISPIFDTKEQEDYTSIENSVVLVSITDDDSIIKKIREIREKTPEIICMILLNDNVTFGEIIVKYLTFKEDNISEISKDVFVE